MNLKEILINEIKNLEEKEEIFEEQRKKFSELIPEIEIKYEQIIDSINSLKKELIEIVEIMEE